MSQPQKFQPRKDSFQKFADDVFKDQDDAFKHVHPSDRDEIRVQFARLVAHEKRPLAALLVFPLHMSEKFKAARYSFSGTPYVTQIKVNESGRIYWAAYPYADEQVAEQPLAA